MSSSSRASQSSGSFSVPSKKVCRHGDEADVFTSMTYENPCRRFHRCPKMKEGKDCRFFEWIDPALPEFQKSCFLRLKSKNEYLEEQLRQKVAMEKMYNGKALEKDEIVDCGIDLEQKLNDLEVEVQKNNEVLLVMKNTLALMHKLERKMNFVMSFLFVVILIVFLSLVGKSSHKQGPQMFL